MRTSSSMCCCNSASNLTLSGDSSLLRLAACARRLNLANSTWLSSSGR